jgi:hypothetical protein
MNAFQFSTKFNITETRSKFVYAAGSSSSCSRKPTQIYRHDDTKFELRNVSNDSVICKLTLDDIIELEAEKDINVQYSKHRID